MKYATVKIGEYTIPLLGISQEATEEICDKCSKRAHITEFILNLRSGVICKDTKGCTDRIRTSKTLTKRPKSQTKKKKGGGE